MRPKKRLIIDCCRFEEGDFADTLMLPMVVATAPIGLRVQPGAMSGYSVM